MQTLEPSLLHQPWRRRGDAADFDSPIRMQVEQRRLQLVGALRRQLHRQRWRCSRRSKQPCSATGACQTDTLLARGDADDARLHI